MVVPGLIIILYTGGLQKVMRVWGFCYEALLRISQTMRAMERSWEGGQSGLSV